MCVIVRSVTLIRLSVCAARENKARSAQNSTEMPCTSAGEDARAVVLNQFWFDVHLKL